MHLLDTNIFIRGIFGHEPEASFVKKCIEKKDVIISPIVIAEFYANVSADQKAIFDKLLARFTILSIDKETAQQAGEYRKQFLRKTKAAFLSDCFLAAQAKLHHLTLVTNNRADFPMKDIRVITL